MDARPRSQPGKQMKLDLKRLYGAFLITIDEAKGSSKFLIRKAQYIQRLFTKRTRIYAFEAPSCIAGRA